MFLCNCHFIFSTKIALDRALVVKEFWFVKNWFWSLDRRTTILWIFFCIPNLVSPKPVICFLLHGPKLKFFLFDGLLGFNVILFFPSFAIVRVGEKLNALDTDKHYFSNSLLSITTDLNNSTQFAIEFLLPFETDWAGKNINPFTPLESWLSRKRHKFFFYGLIAIFKLVFLRNYWVAFFLQDLKLKTLTCVGGYQSKVLIAFLAV